MPISKKRDKKNRLTSHAKKQQIKRREKRIQEIQSLLAQADEWEERYKKEES